jgi:predicted ATPase
VLTRLKVSGFKNLQDVDVAFGPFTCIAGANGVGKSNLFDAITFLSALAHKHTLLEAARLVRSERPEQGNAAGIFQHAGDEWGDEVRFEVEMLVPPSGRDDLGQKAVATSTFLRYSLTLRHLRAEDEGSGLEIAREELLHIRGEEGPRLLPFAKPAWRKSVARGRRTTAFISTLDKAGTRVVKLHSEGGKRGRPKEYSAADLPRTVLSSANATESPTALLACQEMQAWRLLQLEPSRLRSPDAFSDASRIGANGAHLPATLARLAGVNRRGAAAEQESEAVYARIANRLAELVDGIGAVRVDVDQRRELYSIEVTDRGGTPHEARALSDGTLRFLALAILANDPETAGLVCLEEPENGIHPDRIPAMLDLLRDLAVDPRSAVGPDNPLRQVIVNTHSPSVVELCDADDLVVASAEPRRVRGVKLDVAAFQWLDGTWRSTLQPEVRPVPKTRLLAYLNPVPLGTAGEERPERRQPSRRVIDRPDLQLYLHLAPPSVHE